MALRTVLSPIILSLKMHIAFASTLLALLLGSAVAGAAERPYSPKFARLETRGEVVSFDMCPKPEWPKSSLRNEETGTTTLRFAIAPTGRVISSAVHNSSGFRDLDRAAQKSVSDCSFKPATINGVPVQSTVFIQYVWTLK